MTKPYGVGIDLGTTCVAAAVSYGEQASMIALGDRTVVMPSVAYLDEDGQVLCGQAAVEGSLAHPERAAVGFKRRLGDPTPLRLGQHSRSAAELLPELVREVLAAVTSAEGGAPEQVVVTHPATWGPLRLQLLRDAVSGSGVREVVTVPEPVAAAMHYAHQRKLTEPRPVAVYDLGGGTFDVTVLMAHRDHVEILGEPEGIERLGGLDFDDALFRHIDHLCDGALSATDPADPAMVEALAQVRLDCVLAKEHLSTDWSRAVPVYLPERHFQADITRDLFEDLIRVQVESTLGALERCIRSAGLTPEELDGVLLIGGGSRIPLVARMLNERLSCEALYGSHPKHVVALGAARLAGAGLSTAAPAPEVRALPSAVADGTPSAGSGASGRPGPAGGPAETADREGVFAGDPVGLRTPSTPHTTARLLAAALVLVALAAGVLHVVLRTMPSNAASLVAAPDVVEQPCEGSLCDQQQIDAGLEVEDPGPDPGADAIEVAPPVAPKVAPRPAPSRPAPRAIYRPRPAVPVAVRRDAKVDKKKSDKKDDKNDRKKDRKKDSDDKKKDKKS